MIAKEKLGFDPTDADSRDASDIVGARLLTDDGTSPVTSGDGASDDVATGFEAIDTRGFLYAFDGTAWDRLRINSNGELLVEAAIDVDNDFVYDEDSAHTNQDAGAHILAVRQDALASSTSADGDYGSIKANSKGEVYVHDVDANSELDAISTDLAAIEVELLDQGTTLDSILSDTNALVVDLAAIETELLDQGTTLDSIESELQELTYYDTNYLQVIDHANGALVSTAKSVTDTTGALLVSQQANRKFMWVQNHGNKNIWVGASGVTSANGIRMSPGAIGEFRFGAAISLHAVSPDAGGQDVRILEAN